MMVGSKQSSENPFAAAEHKLMNGYSSRSSSRLHEMGRESSRMLVTGGREVGYGETGTSGGSFRSSSSTLSSQSTPRFGGLVKKCSVGLISLREDSYKMSRHRLKQGQQVLNGIHEMIAPLKKRVVDINKQIVSKTDHQAGYSSQISNIHSSKKVIRLEGERNKVMEALDYLQSMEIDIKIRLEEAKESSRSSFRLYPLSEIQKQVEAILSKKAEVPVPLVTSLTKDGWCIDAKRGETRRVLTSGRRKSCF